MDERGRDPHRDYLRIQDLAQPPLPALAMRLGWMGLLPFLGALGAWGLGGFLDDPQTLGFALKAFLVYSALILSFLGGLRWGRVMSAGAAESGYVLAVLPSLWAFPALWLPPPYALLALALGFALVLWFDTQADTLPATPGFRTLRRRITLAVLLGHGLALALWWHFGAGAT